jgi:NTE family protein
MFSLALARFQNLRKTMLPAAITALAMYLSGCALTIQNQPVNVPLESKTEQASNQRVNAVRNIVGENLIGFSFSGGGMRAAAFSFGALKAIEGLENQQPGILDDITFITSVSGGSLTAAFYGLHGKESLTLFREKVLLKDAEADMRLSPARPENFMRLLRGGLNDRDNMANWLDKNIFHGATFEDIYKRKKPDIWINATDVYNRTPFLFIPPVFNALCSDINKFSVAEAVHASMAVPLVFAPVLLKTYPESCVNAGAPWIDSVLANPAATSTVKAMARALKNYRNPNVMKYVKLVDGGVTDNFGLSSILIGRTASRTTYGPFTTQDVLRLKRMVFLVVDAGRGPSGDWVLDKPGPSGFDMALAATDTAIDAAARSSYDGFRLMMSQWQQNIIDFRCSLTNVELRKFEVELSTWDCKDVKFFVGSVNFTDLESQRAARLDAIPTRLSLPKDEIDAAIEAGKDATLINAAFKSFLADRIPVK